MRENEKYENASPVALWTDRKKIISDTDLRW